MCMKYRAICFDFDYTGDSTDSIVGGFQYAFERMGLPIPDRDTVRGTVGYLLEDAYAPSILAVGNGTEQIKGILVQDPLARSSACPLRRAAPRPKRSRR